MTDGPDFTEYDKRMEDPEYRARMDRTNPVTPEEEQELYRLLDEALGEVNPDQPGD